MLLLHVGTAENALDEGVVLYFSLMLSLSIGGAVLYIHVFDVITGC